jgi:hypothetical protein
MENAFLHWCDLTENYKLLTAADLDTDSALYQSAQLYRDKLGKTKEELPDSAIVITMQFNNDSNDEDIIETSITFTVHSAD